MTALLLFHALVVGVLAAVALHALLNHVTFPRLGRMPRRERGPAVSVLIPARNEAARIGRCVGSWAAQRYADYEVLVLDDESTDETATRARAAVSGPAAERVRVIQGGRLPEGWRGKPHACHRLRQH